MSSTPGFDMSLLEGKDRTELAAIAEQLGQKPGARAKKADIVALIMRLVGAEGGGEPGDEEGADAPGEQADQVEAPAGDAPSDAGDGAGAPAETSEAAPSDGSSDERQSTSGSDASAGNGRSEADESDGDEVDGNRRDSNQVDGNQADGNRANQGGGNNQGNGAGEGGDGDGESGNRRRRRRGRDRDRRPEGDEQVQVEPVEVSGMVDLRDEGYGFLRLAGYLPSKDDAYISVKQTRQFGLRTGDLVKGKSRPASRNEKNPALWQVDEVNGHQAHHQPPRPRFDDLTPVFPDEMLKLEGDDPANLTARIIDLVAPIGKGQRGLIVSPPKAGKTTLLKHLVRAIEVNHPEVEVIVLLVDERPEEVTEMQRWLLRGSVAASTFDRPADEHTATAELVIERAKRLVEGGRDVVVVVDGLTRLTRAYNLAAPAGGRTLAGVIDASALNPPKRFFAAARKAEEGGSLTIVATATVETGSGLDEAIFDEFQGTATMELRLDRRLAERQIFPPIDLVASSTRHDELLVDRAQQPQLAALRQMLNARKDETGSNAAGLELLVERLGASRTNAALLADLAKG